MSIQRENIFKGMLQVFVGVIINILLSFFLTPILTRFVCPEDFGRYSLFNLYINISIMVFCLGLDQSLVRYYYQFNSIDYKSWISRRCCILPLFLVLFCSIAFYFITYFKIILFEFSDTYLYFILCLIVHLIFRFGSLLLRLEGDNFNFSIVNVTNKLAFFLCVIVTICVCNEITFVSLLIISIVGFGIAGFTAVYLKRDIWFSKANHYEFSEFIKYCEILKYGIPISISLGINSIFESADKMMLSSYCDYSTVGIYSSAISIVNLFVIVQSTFNTVWAPLSIKHYEENPSDLVFYTKYNNIIIVIMCTFGLTLILFKDILIMLLGTEYRGASRFIPFLILHPIMYTVSETTVIGIIAFKKSSMHIIIAGVSCLINLIGNIVLIPYIGAVGAAISTGLSYIVFYLLRTIISNIFLPIQFSNRKFAVVVVILLFNIYYNTFYTDRIISIIMYTIALFSIFVLYKSTSIYLLNNLVVYIKSRAIKYCSKFSN